MFLVRPDGGTVDVLLVSCLKCPFLTVLSIITIYDLLQLTIRSVAADLPQNAL